MKKTKAIFLFFYFLSLHVSHGQNPNIRGIVKEIYDKDTIAAVHWPVYLNDTLKMTFTDRNGYFLFENIMAGTYIIKIRNVGYSTRSYKLKVEEKDTLLNINIHFDGSDLVEEIAYNDKWNYQYLYDVLGEQFFEKIKLYRNKARKFEKKFNVHIVFLGCSLPMPKDKLTAYNMSTFNHLTKLYGKKWERYIHNDMIGYRNFKINNKKNGRQAP